MESYLMDYVLFPALAAAIVVVIACVAMAAVVGTLSLCTGLLLALDEKLEPYRRKQLSNTQKTYL